MSKSRFMLAVALWLSLTGAAAAQLPPKETPNEGQKQGPLSFTVREPMQPGPSGVGVSLDVEPVVAKKLGGQFVYSAKYVCGRIPHSVFDPQEPPLAFPLVPGTYRSAININNPNLSKVGFTKMALITNPEGQPRGKAGKPVRLILGRDEGLEVDCQDIEGLLTSGSGIDLFNNMNIDTVFNAPPNVASFTLNDPAVIKQLVTYHFNSGHGDPPGTITLRNLSGSVIVGPIPAHGVPGMGGVPNANWVADLNQLVPADTYTVEDSNKGTWAYNQQSGSAGFAIVRGSPSFVGRAPFFKGFVVIRSAQELDVVGVYTVKNVITSAPNPPTPPGNRCPEIAVNVKLLPNQDVYHLHDQISIMADIQGGQPPYNPVVVTLNSRDLRAPYTINSGGTSATNQFSQYWWVYLVGPPPVPGTWGELDQSSISVLVTDANGCKGSGTSRIFTLKNP
jgi:hypothetical protein